MAFQVPEANRMTTGPLRSNVTYGNAGAFLLPSHEAGWVLVCIADDGTNTVVPESLGWEHVSVRAQRKKQSRVPNWREMCTVKDVFWGPDDVVMQLHPRASQYVNQHPHVLHLWRSRTRPIPEPPANLVGTPTTTEEQDHAHVSR